MSEILANVLKTQPDWGRLPAATPEGIRRLLRRCLQKDHKFRFRDMRDARLELDEAQSGASELPDVTRVGSRRRERFAWASALAVAMLIAGVFAFRALRPQAASPEVRLDITTPPTRFSALAVSPDGSKVVFVARSEGVSRLWLRSLDSPSVRPLAGTERGYSPFWSPDNRSIGFFADSNLKRVDINGGARKTLARAEVPLGGTWNRDGTILFGSNPGGPIFRVSAAGRRGHGRDDYHFGRAAGACVSAVSA